MNDKCPDCGARLRYTETRSHMGGECYRVTLVAECSACPWWEEAGGAIEDAGQECERWGAMSQEAGAA